MKKILIISLSVLLLTIGALIAIPFLFKDQIALKIKEEVNKQVNADVNYGDISLSILKTFPNFNFSVENVLIKCKTPEFKGDTLLKIKNFELVLDIMSVWEGKQYKIIKIALIEPLINAKVSKSGKANWDITKPTSSSTSNETSSPVKLDLEKYTIEKGFVFFDDKQKGLNARFENLNYETSGKTDGNLLDFTHLLDIDKATYNNGIVSYLLKTKVHFEGHTLVDDLQKKYTFKDSKIHLNELKLKVEGWVQNKKDINLDIKFEALETDFKNILSLIPAIYLKDFNQVTTKGKLGLKGFIKGFMKDENYPAFDFNASIKDGMFKYPSLPSSVNDIQMEATIKKTQGSLDATNINISKLHLITAGNPIDAKIKILNPITDPYLNASIVGKLDLKNVSAFYPMEDVRKLEGMLQSNVNIETRKSYIDKKQYELVKAAGNLSATGIIYDSKDNPMPVNVPVLSLSFNPKNVTVNTCQAKIGKSDILATGFVDNFISYLFGKGDLTGKLNLNCNIFDANEFLPKKEEKTTSKTTQQASDSYFKVPDHIDFNTKAKIGLLKYEKINMSSVSGDITVKDEQIKFNELSANVFGGSAIINGYYSTQIENKPEASLNYDLKNFDIVELYKTLELTDKIAPVMKHLTGKISSDMKMSMKMKPDMSIDYSSLNGDGKVSIPYAKITGMPILEEITKVAKLPILKNLEMKDAWTVIKFVGGKVFVEPTDLKFGNGYNLNLNGSNSFDKIIDYNLRFDVPGKELSQATGLVQQYIPKIPGVSFSMPETVNFFLKATGPFDKPKISITKISADGKNSVQDVIKDKITDEAKKLEEEAKRRAQEEADKLKKQAEDRIKQESDRLKKEAERKAKEAADKAAKEAKDKIGDIFKFPK